MSLSFHSNFLSAFFPSLLTFNVFPMHNFLFFFFTNKTLLAFFVQFTWKNDSLSQRLSLLLQGPSRSFLRMIVFDSCMKLIFQLCEMFWRKMWKDPGNCMQFGRSLAWLFREISSQEFVWSSRNFAESLVWYQTHPFSSNSRDFFSRLATK